MRLLLACLAATQWVAAADPPAPIIGLFRNLAEALTGQDAGSFLSHFDPQMPGFAQLKDDVEGLLARAPVESTIEFVSDEGGENRRDLELDWLMHPSGGPQARILVKCRVERQSRSWKITRLDPPDLFHRN
jgi:hypothetical protein